MCFVQIFASKLAAMQEDLEQGDVAETVRVFFEQSKVCEPLRKTTLSMQDVSGDLYILQKLVGV